MTAWCGLEILIPTAAIAQCVGCSRSNPNQPQYLFASDVVAYGAISAIIEADLRIPEDIALVGF